MNSKLYKNNTADNTTNNTTNKNDANKHDIKSQIFELLSLNSKDIIENDQKMITECSHYMDIIYVEKGGICVYCRTLFKVLASLHEHQEKKCLKVTKQKRS